MTTAGTRKGGVVRRTSFLVVTVMAVIAAALWGVPSLPFASADTASSIASTSVGQIVNDEARQQVFVSAPDANAVYVFGHDGSLISTITGIAKPMAMVLDGTTLYVAASNSGRIERIDVTTRTKGTFLAEGIAGLQSLAKAAGRLWTVAPCGQWSGVLTAVDPGTGAVTTYPNVGQYISYCGWVMTDPTNTNQLIGWAQGLSPPTLEKIDVADAPTVVASRRLEYASDPRTVTASPDGTRLFPAEGSPYELHELNAATLADSGVVYPAEPYPVATAATPGRGGLVAVGAQAASTKDVWIYDIGDPTAFRYSGDLGFGVVPHGLAFNDAGTRLFAVTAASYGSSATFRVLDITVSGPPTTTTSTSTTTTTTTTTTTVRPTTTTTAPRPQVFVASTQLAFEDQRVGTYWDPKVMEVRNIGGAPMTVRSVEPSGAAPYDFVGATNCLDAPVPPNGTCRVGVVFLPLLGGSRTADAVIETDGGTVRVHMSGNGTVGYVLGLGRGAAVGLGDSDSDDAVGVPLNRPAVGMGRTANGDGAWLVAGDGGIFSFGDAPFFGSTGNMRLNQPIVSIATTPTGEGYWLVAADGGIFSFGDAEFFGSTGSMRLNKPIVGMAATPSGEGYWLVASDGGMFSFGDAEFFGSTGSMRLNKPIVGMAATPSGGGYWLVASDGGMFTFGDARFFGSTGGTRLGGAIVGIASTPLGRGYWLAAADGSVYPFGDAPDFGDLDTGGVPDVVGIVPTAPLLDLGEFEVAVRSATGSRPRGYAREVPTSLPVGSKRPPG